MTKRRKLLAEREQVVEAYVKNEQTLKQIAHFHNVSQGTVRSILIEEGVALRSRGRRKQVDEFRSALPTATTQENSDGDHFKTM